MGFEKIYTQTITLFNRKEENGEVVWYPTVIDGVHLTMDRSIIISTYGEQATDNAMLNIRYSKSGSGPLITVRGGMSKVYKNPKEFRVSGDPAVEISFQMGDEFDFVMEGVYEDGGPISDEDYRNGFFNYMNRNYDNVFAISKVSRYDLIPHFGIAAR